MTTVPASTLRRLAVTHGVDPRSILRELRAPGSVRGMAGERCRQALQEYRAAREAPAAPSKVVGAGR